MKAGYLYTSFGHLATLEASRDGGNTARGISARRIYLLVGYTCSWTGSLRSIEHSAPHDLVASQPDNSPQSTRISSDEPCALHNVTYAVVFCLS